MSELPPPRPVEQPVQKKRSWLGRWWWPMIVAGVLSWITYSVVSGYDSSKANTSTPSGAFCADLRNGLTVMNLWDRKESAEKYAGEVYGRVSISCPEMFSRVDVAALMKAWGYPTS